MKLLPLFAPLMSIIYPALADDPGQPNWCGRFQHGPPSGTVGFAYANSECKNFNWVYPDDTRPSYYRDIPVRWFQNVRCPLCFMFEGRGCKGNVTYMAGAGTYVPGTPTTPLSLSYFCEPPGWKLGD